MATDGRKRILSWEGGWCWHWSRQMQRSCGQWNVYITEKRCRTSHGGAGLRAARYFVWPNHVDETKYVWDRSVCNLRTQGARRGKDCEDLECSTGAFAYASSLTLIPYQVDQGWQPQARLPHRALWGHRGNWKRKCTVRPRDSQAGSWNHSSITWEPVTNADSQAQPRPLEEEAVHKIPKGIPTCKQVWEALPWTAKLLISSKVFSNLLLSGWIHTGMWVPALPKENVSLRGPGPFLSKDQKMKSWGLDHCPQFMLGSPEQEENKSHWFQDWAANEEIGWPMGCGTSRSLFKSATYCFMWSWESC